MLPAQNRAGSANDIVPKRIADALVQCAIADDREPPRLRRDQNQRGVAALVPVQPSVPELALSRARTRRRSRRE